MVLMGKLLLMNDGLLRLPQWSSFLLISFRHHECFSNKLLCRTLGNLLNMVLVTGVFAFPSPPATLFCANDQYPGAAYYDEARRLSFSYLLHKINCYYYYCIQPRSHTACCKYEAALLHLRI